MAFLIPVMEHWLERHIAQWEIDLMTHRTMRERSTTQPIVLMLVVTQTSLYCESNSYLWYLEHYDDY